MQFILRFPAFNVQISFVLLLTFYIYDVVAGNS
jgi:hypothetical protein